MEGIKCVIVLNEELSAGLVANTAAVLALTLGNRMGSLLGPDVHDKSGQAHVGITAVPIPILKSKNDNIRNIKKQANAIADLLVVDFTDAAQTTTTYADYTAKLASMPAEELSYLGIALCGDKKAVNRLTGSLPLFR